MTGKRVSKAEFARLWADRSISTDEIGRHLGITRQAVSQRAQARGLPPRQPNQERNRAIPPERDDEFRTLWEARVSVAEMCRRLGCRPWNIRQHANRLGFQPRVKGWRPYAANPALVRRLFDVGLCWGDIAKATGTTVPSIRRIAKRLGLNRARGWKPALTLDQWREDQIAARMRAAVEQRRAA